MPENTISPVRVAIREEGEWINFYLASADTMDEAVLISTLRRTVGYLPGVRKLTLDYAEALTRIMVDAAFGPGSFLGIDQTPAPEHERSGHA